MKKWILCYMLWMGMYTLGLTGCTETEQLEHEVVQTEESEARTEEMVTVELETDETPSAATEETESEEANSSLDEELLAIEDISLELQNQLENASTQYDMNSLSAQIAQLWDDELNDLWSRFVENASEEFKAVILDEQREWIKEKEYQIELMSNIYEGGSIQPLMVNTRVTDLTRIRCYELAIYLAEASGQRFSLGVPKQEALIFVDRQGSVDVVFSELIMEKIDVDIYFVTMGIFRLTTAEGQAIRQSDNVYEFEEEHHWFKGIIRIFDDNSGATFEVTESDDSLFEVGQVFEFPQRDFDREATTFSDIVEERRS